MKKVTNEAYKHLSILAAHIAQKIIEDEGIDDFCKSPCDLAVICHEKRYVKKDLIGKMLFHISEYEYMERRGEVFVLEEKWRRMLPTKINSQKYLREYGFNKIHLFQEILAKKFLEIVRNESQKLELNKLIYYLDAIYSGKGLNNLRSELISSIDFRGTPGKIFDLSYGFGYSAVQLAHLFQDSEVFSIQLISALKDAFEFTISRHNRRNLAFAKSYPSEITNKLMKEKVDGIFMFNPLGLACSDLDQFLGIANQIAKEGTKLLLMIPFKDEPTNTLIAEWLGFCVENLGPYNNPDYYRVILPKHGFEINNLSTEKNLITATFHNWD